VTSARVTTLGFAIEGAAPFWGRFAAARDPLAAAAAEFVGARNPRLPRLDRTTLAALVAAHLAQSEGGVPAALLLVAEDGSAAADRAYWATARERGGVEASPTLFAATLPSAVAGELAMTFALRGPCLVVAGRGALDGDDGGFAGREALGRGPCLCVRLGGREGEASARLGRPARSGRADG
jgi:hypothetical protein